MLTTPAPRSLCLVRLSALGDVVMVLPLVRWLRRCWPGTALTWIHGRGVEPLLESADLAGVERVAIDKPSGWRDYVALRGRFAGRRFDAVLGLQASWRANWIYPCLRARRKIGYGADRAKDGHRWFVHETLPPAKPHLVDGFLQFAEALGLPWPDTIEWGLRADPVAVRAVASRLPEQPFLAVNACSSKAERDWPAERYAAVMAHVASVDPMPTVLIGGPAPREREMAERIRALAGAAPITDLVGRTSLPEMVAVLSLARGLLAPDTGAVHIARALGKPVCGLYAVAPARRTGPYGATQFCVDRFEEAVRTLLRREPASLPWARRVHDPRAMPLITVGDVLEKIDLLRGRTGG